jgi:thymidine phosphorylase
MRDSGETLDWAGLDGPVLDKHSTGGVGDLVSLVLGPVVAACGAYVPMISGRGLGHTGGTLDKLESIPGFNSALDLQHFRRCVKHNRLAIVGQTDELAPVDRRIYAVRDVTATVASPPLIISSILSKKLAEGLDALLLDVKYGSGAFMQSPDQALSLARSMCRVADMAGLPGRALVTDMDAPLARSAGNALEVREAVEILRGDRVSGRLVEAISELSAHLLDLGALAASLDDARTRVRQALETGAAAERFEQMVQAQGGPKAIMDSADRLLPRAPIVQPVFPREAGWVAGIDTRAVGRAVVQLGGGRNHLDDRIDPAVGLSDITGIGEPVDTDTPLAMIHARDEPTLALASATLVDAYSVAAEATPAGALVHAIANGD